MHQSQALVYGRTIPGNPVSNIAVCGIDFTPEWLPIHNVDAATVARLAADVNIEVSLQYPGGLPFVMEKLAAAEVLVATIPVFEAAIQDTNLALAMGSFALSKTGVLEKSIATVKERWVQTGVVSISQALTKDLIRSYGSAVVTLPVAYMATDYQVHFEVVSGMPTRDFVGEVLAKNKSTNGFVVEITGSATAAFIKWTATYFSER